MILKMIFMPDPSVQEPGKGGKEQEVPRKEETPWEKISGFLRTVVKASRPDRRKSPKTQFEERGPYRKESLSQVAEPGRCGWRKGSRKLKKRTSGFTQPRYEIEGGKTLGGLSGTSG